jgi:hypothetical protein
MPEGMGATEGAAARRVLASLAPPDAVRRATYLFTVALRSPE